MIFKKILKNRATTLLEILVYFAIFAAVMLAATSFSIQILKANRLSGNFNQSQSELDFINHRVTTAILQAESIDLANSTFDDDQGAISLNLSNPALSPTRFYLQSGDIYIRQGTGSAVQLNTGDTEFTIFRFHRVTNPKTPDQIVIDMDLRTRDVDIDQVQKNLKLHLTLSLR